MSRLTLKAMSIYKTEVFRYYLKLLLHYDIIEQKLQIYTKMIL